MHLSIKDFENPVFNSRLSQRRDKKRRRKIIEGLTFTDNYRQVGFTYYPGNGELTVSCLDETQGQQRLYEGKIKTIGDFEVVMRQVDKDITRKNLRPIAVR